VRDDDGLQLDFMATIHGTRSFAGLRSIRRRLALPVEKRMNFLRKRVGFRGSAL
jgi:hypothetical protein